MGGVVSDGGGPRLALALEEASQFEPAPVRLDEIASVFFLAGPLMRLGIVIAGTPDRFGG